MCAPPVSHRSKTFPAFVAPFVAFVLLLGVGQAIGTLFKQSGFFLLDAPQYWIFPTQTILCAAMLWWFWPSYRFCKPEKIGLVISIAVLVLAIWISPQELFGFARRYNGFNPMLFENNCWIYTAELAFRFARLVIVVPLIEEIFWRGFLLRYVIREDFENVPLGAFTWLSFGMVTICFAFEHNFSDMPAALATSALYNFLIYKTRSLGSCVLAHALTNLGLGLYVMATKQWGFW
jgi:uncharacterized protein